MKLLITCLILAALCGCQVAVEKKSLTCDPPGDTLTLCGSPESIAQGITFEDVIKVAGRDRDNFRKCALRHEDLVKAYTTCKDAVDKYNASIR